jgi:hypothetical protein
MKHKLFLLLLLVTCLQVQAQQTTFSERAYRIGTTGRKFSASTLTRQGNILFSGPIANINNWEKDIFYLITPNLDTVWSRKGPIISRVEQDLAATVDGGFILAGTLKHRVNNRDTEDMLLHKINANGQQIWTRTIDASVLDADMAFSVLNMPDRGYVIGGRGGIPNKESLYSIIRTDSLGNIIWRRSFDRTSSDRFTAMCRTQNGNILTVGNKRIAPTLEHIKLQLINSNGDSLTSNVLNLHGVNRSEAIQTALHNVISLSDGGFLMNAWLDTTINGNLGFLGMLVKVDSNLQPVWKHVYRPFFTPHRNFIKAQELADGSIVAVGYDMPTGIQPATGNIYLHHISAIGAPINLYTFTSAYPVVEIKTMQAMPDSSFIVGGTCYNANNDRAFYVAKLKVQGLPKVISGLPSESIAQKIELGQSYPNPTASTAIIPYTLPVSYRHAQIIVRDITGREVGNYALKKNSSSLEVNLSNLHNGLYTYTLQVDGKPVATKKLAVMK